MRPGEFSSTVDPICGKKNKTHAKDRVYLNVSYAKKEHAKALGAKWDSKKKKWYSMKMNDNLKELVMMY